MKNKNTINQLQSYTKLLSQISRAISNNTGIGEKNNIKLLEKLQTFSLTQNLLFLLSAVAKIGVINLPSHFNPSLTEIFFNGESVDYDFLATNSVYIVDLSRRKLLFRNLINIKNIISLKKPNTNYDIFHCTHLSPIVVPGIPRVTTVHDIIPLLRPELVNNELFLVFSKLVELNLRESTKIIAVSETTKKDLVNYCGVPEDRISVVYEAASSQFLPISEDQALPILRLLGLIDSSGKRTPYFIFVGNIEPKKNIKRLLTAFKEFALKDQVGYKLVIVGSKAWGYEPVKNMISEMIESKILIHPGYLPSSYLPALLSHARAFIFPSLIEGFGLPVLEAMACGCPVISSKIQAISEVAGDAALLVNPQSVEELCQAITETASNDQLCLSLKEKGLKRNQLFSWKKCATQTLDVYAEAYNSYFNCK
ncbi:MAG: glycosyltransferase family 1 protein [Crinalium sp.]